MKCMKWSGENTRIKVLDNKLFLGKVKVMGAGGQSGLEVKVTKIKEIKLLFKWGYFYVWNCLMLFGF